MKISINPELESFIVREVESGRYGSAEEIVSAALLLMERGEALSAFRGELNRRIAASDRGEVVDAQTVLERLQRRSDEARPLRA